MRAAQCRIRLLGILAVAVASLFTINPAVAQSIEWLTLNKKSLYLLQVGKYEEGVVVAKKSLEVAEKDVGSDHPAFAKSLHNLGEFYSVQGKYSDAEPLFKRALAINEKALGLEHPDVATNLNNLGKLYAEQR